MILPLAAAARLAASAAACGPARGKAARGRGSRTMPLVRAASLRPTGAPAGASQRQARGPLGSSANVQKMHFVQLLRETQRNKINFLCNCPPRRWLQYVPGGSRAARRNGVASSPATAAACGPARFCRACGAVCGFGAYPPPPSAGYGGAPPPLRQGAIGIQSVASLYGRLRRPEYMRPAHALASPRTPHSLSAKA